MVELDEFGLDDAAWQAINPRGGKPKVETEAGGITRIIHGDGMEVRSHKSLWDYGIAVVEVLGQTLRVPVALIQSLHGDPCEKQSRRIGGDGYDRVK